MNALTLKNLHKIYDDGHVALKGINLDVAEGDFFSLLGVNGAGKSTTIGIVCGLLEKTRGEVAVFGHDIVRDPIQAKMQIGLVPQEFNFNIFETPYQILRCQAGYYGITYREAKIRIEHCLRQLDLWDRRHQQARMLSGGMKRRLMIARALVHQPRLLILDEPTAGVDIEIRRVMWSLMQAINRAGTTIILTTHYLEEAEHLCKKIAIIHDGLIVENTAMKTLLQSLQNESFILYLEEDRPGIANSAADLRFKRIEQGVFEVEKPKAYSINQLLDYLSRQGVSVLSLRNKTNRLEELFLNLVRDNDTV